LAYEQRKKPGKEKTNQAKKKGVTMRIRRTAVKTFEIEFDFNELEKLDEVQKITGHSPTEIIARTMEEAFEHAEKQMSKILDAMLIAGARSYGNERRKTKQPQ